MDWMRGKSCGLCGQADGETRQEFRTPSGRLTQNAVSHAFSWVLPARSCRENTGEKHSQTVNCFKTGLTHNDKPRVHQQLIQRLRSLTECRMRLESVRMEREMIVHGHQSRCYSVEPVLRCLPGCFAVKTATVDVGFHCVPTGESQIRKHTHTTFHYLTRRLTAP